MKFALTAALLLASTSAHALVADGVTYTLTENSITNGGKTASFTLTISGENTASDTEGGRTGINAIAFNQPAPGTVTTGVMSSPSGFQFILGGLNAAGCDGNGNFYCFDNTAIPPTPTTALSGPLTFNFTVTADQTGVWAGYTTAFKIDWVGTQNNYDLVSLPIAVIPGTTCIDCTPTPTANDVSEPGSLTLLGGALLTTGLILQRRRRRQ
jgi:hypothetical protein